MKNLNSRLILSLSLGFSLLTSACTHIRPQPVKPLDAQALAGAKTSASVALVLDAPFTNYTYSYDMSGDKFEFPLGSALVQSATNAAQAACQQVAVCASRQEAAGKADAILIPKVTRVNTKKRRGICQAPVSDLCRVVPAGSGRRKAALAGHHRRPGRIRGGHDQKPRTEDDPTGLRRPDPQDCAIPPRIASNGQTWNEVKFR